MESETVSSLRILILAPAGLDARNASIVLAEVSYASFICRDAKMLSTEVTAGCAAIVLTEEAIATSTHRQIWDALDRQPPWSDIPVILITSGGQETRQSQEAAELLGPRGNIVLIERPLRRTTLIASARSAMRARLRQYEVRDLLAERDALLLSMEQRVTERTASLEDTIGELEAFSYGVSHDLRAPLRALQGYADVLHADYGGVLDEQGAQYLGRIKKAASRMDHLTRDLLMYSKVTRGNVPLVTVDLDVLLHDVIEQYPSVNAARHRLAICTPLGSVSAHEPSLIQCFSNLIENALKFVPPGVVPTVQIHSERSNGRVRVFVKDNGIGIDPANHERIFALFERVPGEQIPGTGIGLAIVKKAIARMNGSVGVISAPGKGSNFWIELNESPEPEKVLAEPSAAGGAFDEGTLANRLP